MSRRKNIKWDFAAGAGVRLIEIRRARASADSGEYMIV